MKERKMKDNYAIVFVRREGSRFGEILGFYTPHRFFRNRSNYNWKMGYQNWLQLTRIKIPPGTNEEKLEGPTEWKAGPWKAIIFYQVDTFPRQEKAKFIFRRNTIREGGGCYIYHKYGKKKMKVANLCWNGARHILGDLGLRVGEEMKICFAEAIMYKETK